VKDWIKAIKIVLSVFFGLALFHIIWPTAMKLSPNENYISSVRDTSNHILAVFGDKTILNNRLTTEALQELEKKESLNRFPIVPVISFEELPKNYTYFLTKVENKSFFGFGKDNVYGMSFSGLARLMRGKADGGSNISQQLLKNIIHKKDGMGTIYLSRKYGEQLASFQMYKAASPEEIIVAYTNYAGNFWYEQDFSGLILASYAIFNRAPHELNDLEMLLTVKTLKSGRELKTLCANKFVNREQIKASMLHYFELIADNSETDQNILKSMRNLELGFAKENNLRKTSALTNFFSQEAQEWKRPNPLQYVTSIHKKNQEKLTLAVAMFRKKFQKQLQVKEFDLEFAVVAVDIKTGQIEASFGNRKNSGATANFTNYGNGFQCGSVLKPFVFLELFTHYEFDEKTKLFNGNLDQFSYNPKNVGNMLKNKEVTVRDIFKYSLNKAAVNHRLMANPVTVAKQVEQNFKIMGIPANPEYYIGESYTLGTRTITPLDLAQGYQMIFNNGVAKPLSPWMYIIDGYTADTLYNSTKAKQTAVYDAHYTTRIKNLLPASFEAGGTCHRLLRFLPQGRSYYGKTGTTGKAIDGWTVLSDGDKLIVAWVGYVKNNDGILQRKGAPAIPSKSGGGSAGVLAAMTYSKLYN